MDLDTYNVQIICFWGILDSFKKQIKNRVKLRSQDAWIFIFYHQQSYFYVPLDAQTSS